MRDVMQWEFGGQILSNSRAQLPVVSKLNNGHHVVNYSKRDKLGRSHGFQRPLTCLFPPQLGPEVSILCPGEPGDTDVAGVMPMQQVNDFLYYIGWTLRKDVPYFNYLSVARQTSAGFSKIGPILAPDIVDKGFSGTFFVMKFGGKYFGYYLSVVGWSQDEDGNLNPEYNIRVAVSTDALNWRRLDKTALELAEGEAGISAMTVIKRKGVLHAWFSVRGSKNFRTSSSGGYRIIHAVSHDGVSWKRDAKFGLSPGFSSGIKRMVAYPSVYTVKGKLVMLFNGDGFGENGIFWCWLPLASLDLVN
jgi:hypothetical protein